MRPIVNAGGASMYLCRPGHWWEEDPPLSLLRGSQLFFVPWLCKQNLLISPAQPLTLVPLFVCLDNHM